MAVTPTSMPENLKNYANYVLGGLESDWAFNMFERSAHMGFGYTQWSGSRALTLMRRILAESSTFFDSAPTPEKTYILNNNTSVWTEGYGATNGFCQWWADNGNTSPCPNVQVQLSKEDMDGYLQYLDNQGIIFGDWKCVIGFISLMHWYGNGGAVKYFGGFDKSSYAGFKSSYKGSSRAYYGAGWKITRGDKLFSMLDAMTDSSDWDYQGTTAMGQDPQEGAGSSNSGQQPDQNISIPSNDSSQYGGMTIEMVSDKTAFLMMGDSKIAFQRFANNIFCNGMAQADTSGSGNSGGSDSNTIVTQPDPLPITPPADDGSLLSTMAQKWAQMIVVNYTQLANRTSFGDWQNTNEFANGDCSSTYGTVYRHYFGVLGGGNWTGSLRDIAPWKIFLGATDLATFDYRQGDGIIWVKDINHNATVHIDMIIDNGVGARCRGFGTSPCSYAWMNEGSPTMPDLIAANLINRHYAWVCRYVEL